MALASAPSTPNRGSTPYLFRRSFTAPIKSSRTISPAQEASNQGAETLYSHPAGKIVSFSSNDSKLTRRHSSISDTRSDFQDDAAGSLPWASTTERTIAAGPIQIYRVLGSVAFLNSGTILHPVLAKSQCWCVDGVSKFVLRIRPNTYYRIELPHESRQDEEKAEELKKVLPKILQYEVTPCPFKRGFTVDLPEPPETPVQKKPWRPKAPFRSLTQGVTDELDQLDELEEEVSKEKYPEDLGVFHSPPKDHPPLKENKPLQLELTTSLDASSPSSYGQEAQKEVAEHIERFNRGDDGTSDGSIFDEPANLKTTKRPKPLRTWRTVTAPPQLSLRTSPPSTSEAETFPVPLDLDRQLSVSSSIESFHSFHSPISPLAASPTSSNSSPEQWAAGLDYAKTRGHARETSEITITGRQPGRWDMADDKKCSEPNSAATLTTTNNTSMEQPKTPTLPPNETSWSDAAAPLEAPTPKQVRLRRARRRPRSPLPSSTNLYSPYSPRNHMSGHHLTTAILQRTCSLLLGPPVQLVALMLRIAAKIARGAFQGSVCGVGEGGQRIPCSWDFGEGSASDDDDEYSGKNRNGESGAGVEVNGIEGEEEEDDYGFSLGKTVSGKDVRAKDLVGGGSWEID